MAKKPTKEKVKKVIFSVNISEKHKVAFVRICIAENRNQSGMFEMMIDNWIQEQLL